MPLEVVAADHRAHLAGLVVDHHRRGIGPDARQVRGDPLLGRALEVRVERGGHPQPAAERRARAVALHQLLRHPGREVGLGGVELGWVDVALRGDHLVGGVGVRRLAQHVLLEHVLEHEVAPLLRLDGVLDRVIGGRRRDHRGEHRGLRGREVDGEPVGGAVATPAAAEVGASGGLDPIGAVPEVHGVEVLGEDLVLRPAPFEVVGERRLAQLLEHCPVALGGEGVLHELLGDRRAALGGVLLQDVLPHGPSDAPEVHALVLVEAAVLDRDHRVLHVRRDLAGGEEDAVLRVGQPRYLLSPVIRVDGRVPGRPELGHVLERGQLV